MAINTVTEEIVVGLLDRRFDLGLISLPVAESNLTIMPLFDEELLVVRPSAKSLRGGRVRSIPASALAGVPFLLYPKRSNVRLLSDQFFREINVTPRVVMEADDTEAIKRLVESGSGYSILPERPLRGRTRFFETYRVEGHRIKRSLALAMPQTEFPRELTESIANFLRSQLASN
jgi:DNA-binding transcriptional LysR family regulator